LKLQSSWVLGTLPIVEVNKAIYYLKVKKSYEITLLDSERRGRMAVSKPYISTAPASIKRAR